MYSLVCIRNNLWTNVCIIKGLCRALSKLMIIFGFDPLETEIVLKCWSVSYSVFIQIGQCMVLFEVKPQ